MTRVIILVVNLASLSYELIGGDCTPVVSRAKAGAGARSIYEYEGCTLP